MCGIFGLVANKDFHKNFPNKIKDISTSLFSLSQTRGSEAAGIAINDSGIITVLKDALSPKYFIKEKNYNSLFKNSREINLSDDLVISPNYHFSLIGHSRLVTNGNQSESINNQPVIAEGMVGVHNGIITNEKELLEVNKDIKKESDLDSELLFKLLNKNFIDEKNILVSINKTLKKIKGSLSIAYFIKDNLNLILTTNTGSLFFLKNDNLFIFASERFILQSLLKKHKIIDSSFSDIFQLNVNNALIFDLKEFSFKKNNVNSLNNLNQNQIEYEITNIEIKDKSKSVKNIKRCTNCVLPETYPFMNFDKNGVCRYCRRHKKFEVKGEDKLFEKVAKYRNKNGKPDCIVAFSGGRDSSYGLHYIKKILGMNPIAFTYDWGFVSDLARRNTARICGELGIEHIFRTPDISRKRKNVRLNVEAWLKKPELGMIPIFMAGDKAFYYHARELRKETGIKLVFFCTGNMMEDTPYKFGYSGIKGGESGNTLTGVSLKDKVALLSYYFKNYLLNPSYINQSIFDTAAAYWHTFIKKDDFIYLYQYLEWEEKTVVDTIIKNYGWETSKDTNTTWRIGDSTASFYNYIYYTVAGFSEDDDMLSSMVREGVLTREEALKKSIDYAKPRKESLQDYMQTIGLNYNETLTKINKIKKIF